MTLKSYISISQIRDDGSIYYIKITFDELIKTYLQSPIPDYDDFSQNLNKLSLNYINY